jgi:diguanylate cyclase (GGDEF)-like protein
VVRLFGTMQDITDRRQAEARLEHATHYDTLTDLPNRHWLFERLQHALKSRDASPLALLVLNIDRFAQLNESLGRALGDQALVALARRWAGALPEGCALARLDADQFAVLDEHHDVSENVLATATSLMEATRQPLRLGSADNPVELTLSIGIALYPNDADEPSRLLHAAEDALRNAKADKGNKVRFYDRQHAQAAITRFETEAALRQALARDEFFLVYQPQADAASGRVNGVEALLRWRRGDQVVPPGRFIGVVESTDLAEPVSRWVLQSACRQARQWLDRQHPLRVAVNIFSDHVTSGHLLDDVRRALRDSGLPPALLELEVVESSLLSNPEIAALTLRELKRLGVGLALDDFGTGYSSLGYLKHYPFDVLKIDQIFARNVTRDPEDAAIVRSTIALAHNLGMRVLAEGVETEPQLRFMARYGCDLIQGYLLGRPTTPQEVELQVMGRRDLRPHGAAQAHETPGVLILEGDAGEAETLIAQLAGDGFRPYAAGDLDAALDILGRERIDLILCGDHLGDTSGVEALERLRHLFPDVPRVMCSARAEQAVTVDALNRAGIRAWLARPAPPETLLATVRGILADNNGRA